MIRDAWECGRLDLGMRRLLEAYEVELKAVLRGRLRDEHAVGEAYQMACEGMWKSWPRFEWRSTCLAWARAICSKTAVEYLRSPHLKVERNISLSDAEHWPRLVEHQHVSTADYRRTENKSRLKVLIERLDRRDRTMLSLRIYQRLSWKDVARALEGEFTCERELVRATNRLRKRFQAVTRRLKVLLEASGGPFRGGSGGGSPIGNQPSVTIRRR